MKARTDTGANIDSYYYLVDMMLQAQITTPQSIASNNQVRGSIERIHGTALRNAKEGNMDATVTVMNRNPGNE